MSQAVKTVGRYTICGEIAAGGMATVHIGRAAGHGGFARTVAIKRLHPQFAQNPDFVAMFLDEAWLAARIHHPNVVQTHDVVCEDGELYVVMDYTEGETLSRISRVLREQRAIAPVAVTAGIVTGILHGLHAAHEAKDEAGVPLQIVHRDVSPQNVIVGADGVARLVDFGVAKATVRMQSTREGQLKGKLAYMAPEQLEKHQSTRSSDIYAASVLLWEALAGRRLFEGETEGQLLTKVLCEPIVAPSAVGPHVDPALDEIVMRGVSREPEKRFATAREMALAIERTVEIARMSQVADWLAQLVGPSLADRAMLVSVLLGSTVPPPRSSSVLPVGESTGVRTMVEPPPSYPSSGSVRAGPHEGTGGSRGSSPSGSSSSVPSRSSSSRPRRQRVLVVDDSEIVLQSIRRTLEAEGIEVIATTQTVGNARHLVDTELVIIDYHMPGLDGGTVIASLRAAAATKNHRCLFYLYTQDDEAAKDYAKLGFDGCFTQKGDDRALVRQVRSVFRVAQLRAMRK